LPIGTESTSHPKVVRVDDLFWYAIAAVDWASVPSVRAADGGPRNSVPAGLRRIDAASDEAGATEACIFMLDAVGDNDANRLLPVLLPAMHFLLQIAVEGEPWSRQAALQVVTEALKRAPGEVAADPLGVDRAQVLRHIRPWQRRLEALDTPDQIEPVRSGAQELLAALDA
jgi:hypothetical protein